jgi:hypothetical protein
VPQIKYTVAGVENVETIPEELVEFYLARPLEYTLVVDEAAAAELKGAELLEAARNAGVEAPTTLSADEKRHAIVDATAPAGEVSTAPGAAAIRELDALAEAGTPEPPADPQVTTKRRTAAKES